MDEILINDPVAAGAAVLVKRAEANRFGDWVKVGAGLAELRRQAVELSGVKGPAGAAYGRALNQLCEESGYGENFLPARNRTGAILCHDLERLILDFEGATPGEARTAQGSIVINDGQLRPQSDPSTYTRALGLYIGERARALFPQFMETPKLGAAETTAVAVNALAYAPEAWEGMDADVAGKKARGFITRAIQAAFMPVEEASGWTPPDAVKFATKLFNNVDGPDVEAWMNAVGAELVRLAKGGAPAEDDAADPVTENDTLTAIAAPVKAKGKRKAKAAEPAQADIEDAVIINEVDELGFSDYASGSETE